MNRRTVLCRTIAAALLVALPTVGVPAAASADGALAGVVISTADRAPLTGARVHMADSRSGRIISSAATADDGSFTIETVPAASYKLAVESSSGLYLVGSPVQIVPGQTRDVDLAVDDRAVRPNSQSAGTTAAKAGKVGLWNNPATAALVVLGSAFVVGVLVEDATTDEDEPSPSAP